MSTVDQSAYLSAQNTQNELFAALTQPARDAVKAAEAALEAAITTNSYGDFESCSLAHFTAPKRTLGVRISVLDGWRRGMPRKHVEYITTDALVDAHCALKLAEKNAKKTPAMKAAAKAVKETGAAVTAALSAAKAERDTGNLAALIGEGLSAERAAWLIAHPQTLKVMRAEGMNLSEEDESDAVLYIIRNNTPLWQAYQMGELYGEEFVRRLMGSHRRHTQTNYDAVCTELRERGIPREDAREMARSECC